MGQLDAAGLCRPDVQDDFKVHCAIRDALTCALGRGAVVQERLGYGISDFTMTRRMHTFTYPFSLPRGWSSFDSSRVRFA